MGKKSTAPPPVREFHDHIQIDQKRGEWPFTHIAREPAGGLLIAIDQQQLEEVASEGVGQAAIHLSPKKSKALLDFLNRTAQ